MRTMLRISMDVEAANLAIRNGDFKKHIQPIIDGLKPESCYFTTEAGKRTTYLVFDLADPSEIPRIAEPFFQLLRAEIDFRPVMNREDLAKGLGKTSFQKAA